MRRQARIAIPTAERLRICLLVGGTTVFAPLERSRVTESGLAFLIDCEEDRTLRAVLVGMLLEADRES
jgi:hypothetical protein